MPVSVNIGDAQKFVTAILINAGDVSKAVLQGYVNVGDVPKLFYGPLAAPDSFHVISDGTTTINVQWGPPLDTPHALIDGYHLEYRVGSGNWTQVVTSFTSYNISGLSALTTYSLRVRAYNSQVDGEWSPTLTEQTDALGTHTFSETITTSRSWTVPSTPAGYLPITGIHVKLRSGDGGGGGGGGEGGVARNNYQTGQPAFPGGAGGTNSAGNNGGAGGIGLINGSWYTGGGGGGGAAGGPGGETLFGSFTSGIGPGGSGGRGGKGLRIVTSDGDVLLDSGSRGARGIGDSTIDSITSSNANGGNGAAGFSYIDSGSSGRSGKYREHNETIITSSGTSFTIQIGSAGRRGGGGRGGQGVHEGGIYAGQLRAETSGSSGATGLNGSVLIESY